MHDRLDRDTRLDRLAHALADRTRRRLLERLAEAPGLTSGELVSRSRHLTRWTVLKHLAVLRDVMLVQTFPEGRRRRHYLNRAAVEPLSEWLERGLRSASAAQVSHERDHHDEATDENAE